MRAPTQAIDVGAEVLRGAVLAAGHSPTSATVVHNLAAVIAARGALEVNHIEQLADMFGMPVERLIAKDFDPRA